MAKGFFNKKSAAKKGGNNVLSQMEQTDPARALVEYAGLGDIAGMQRMLKAGAAPDTLVSFDITVETILEAALHAASGNGRTQAVAVLLAAGADVDLVTEDGWRAVHAAGMGGHAGVVAALASGRADLDACEGMFGHTGLMKAARMGHIDTVQAFIDAGADRTIRDNAGFRAQDMVCDQSGLADGAQKTALHGRILDIFFKADQREKQLAAQKAEAEAARAAALDNVAVLQRDMAASKPLRLRLPKR